MDNKMLKLMQTVTYNVNCITYFKEIVHSELNEVLCTFSFFNEYNYVVVRHKESNEVFVFIESTKFEIIRCMSFNMFTQNTGLTMIEQLLDFDIVSQALFGLTPAIVDGYHYNPNLSLGNGKPLSLKFYCDVINFAITSSTNTFTFIPEVVTTFDDNAFRITLKDNKRNYIVYNFIQPTKELLHPDAINIFYSLTNCANEAYWQGKCNGVDLATKRATTLIEKTMKGALND